MEISIDRLTICGNLFGNMELFYANCSEIERRGFAKYPYRDSIHFMDGSVLQIGEIDAVRNGKIKQLRYDFNPNRKKFEKLHMAVIGLMKDSHLTRVDVAFDIFDMDMSYWKWIDSKGRPYRVYYSGGGEVETWYVGGKDSDIVLRIYNKAKEQKVHNKVWWRVEVQLRGETAKNMNLLEGQALNPFEHVTPVLDGSFPELDVKRRAMVNYLIQFPSGFSELGSKAKSEYRKLLRLIASWECMDLYKVWNEKSSLVGSEVRSWLSLAKML